MKTLLFGSNSFDTNANTNVFNAIIEYVLYTKRFEEPLFQRSEEIFKQGFVLVSSVSILIVTCLFFIICKFSFRRVFFLLFSCILTILGTLIISVKIVEMD